ncbi:MAG: 50S ribosomal protein L24e [Nanoarchaeota archaeon]
MVKCTFCGKEEKSFKGVHVIKNTGTVNYFCSSKCRTNSEKLKRDKRKVRWTEAFHITREKARKREKEAKEKAKAEKETPKEKSTAKKPSKKKS